MGKKKKEVVMVACPWGCKDPIPQDKYAEHLMTTHFKKKDKKVLGPFPAGTKKED